MASFDKQGKSIGVVGATGAVGIEIIKCLFKRSFKVAALRLYASARSAGTVSKSHYGDIVIEEFTVENARKCDIVFLAVSGAFALKYAREISKDDGPTVIDNSSAFRYMPDIPLVIPEINSHTAKGAKLIANPNCTTAIAVVVLWPLHQKYKLKN